MAILYGGIDSDLIGRLGKHVGRRVKGKNVIGMRPGRGKRIMSQGVKEQQRKFSLLSKWFKMVMPILRIGFRQSQSRMTVLNAAIAYHLKHALVSNLDMGNGLMEYVLDLSRVRLSIGKWRPPETAQVSRIEDDAIGYSWSDSIGEYQANLEDEISLVVYNETKRQFVFKIAAAKRADRGYVLELPADWHMSNLHHWLLARSADQTQVSNSVYIKSE